MHLPGGGCPRGGVRWQKGPGSASRQGARRRDHQVRCGAQRWCNRGVLDVVLQHAAELRAEKNIEATMEKISAELDKVDAGVFAEIGADHDNRTLVLSVDGKKDLFPIVQKVYAARPTVPGWTILAFRQRDSGFAIEMQGKKIEPSTVKFVATPNGGKLDVQVFLPRFADHDQMAQIGFVMLDHSVGEYDMETKIGGIEFSPLEQAPATAKPLVELGAAVDALK